MGIGRFAYTPMLPLMHAHAGLSAGMAGVLASSNLAGYLAGVLLAMAPALRGRRLATVRGSIAAVILATAAMAIPSLPLWIVLRFVTGVASGFAFVLCSSLVLDRAAREGKPAWAGWLYAGVGIGIVLSAAAIPPSAASGGWQGGWLGLALVSAALVGATILALRDEPAAWRQPERLAAAGRDRRLFWWLFAAYGGEGLGYIIPATFMVAMFVRVPTLAPVANVAWALVGCVAIPSTLVWNRLGLRLGAATALGVALAVQAAGTLAPIVAPNAYGATLAAISLGGTFMGITTLANALGRELYPERSHVAIGRLATIFGAGQIAGPLVATSLTLHTGTYDAAIVAAACALFLSSALMFVGARGRSTGVA